MVIWYDHSVLPGTIIKYCCAGTSIWGIRIIRARGNIISVNTVLGALQTKAAIRVQAVRTSPAPCILHRRLPHCAVCSGQCSVDYTETTVHCSVAWTTPVVVVHPIAVRLYYTHTALYCALCSPPHWGVPVRPYY